MEEILASIRRIIESNEPAAGNAGLAAPLYAVSDEEDEGDIRLTVEEAFEAAAFNSARAADPRFVAANSPGEAQPVPTQQRTMSLADVAARVRAASERSAAQVSGTLEAPPPRELPPAIAARIAESRPAVEQAAPAFVASEPLRPTIAAPAPVVAPFPAQVAAPVAATPELPAEIAPEPVERPAVEEPAFVAPPVEAAIRPSLPSVREPLPHLQEEIQPALMSEAAGAQVARSFEELVAAVDGGERRSLDEIAQDMLRPMLQEWLDDNLPTLVERLVREEIERVARGPRR